MRSSLSFYSSVASVIGAVLATVAAAQPVMAQSIEDTMAAAYTQSTQLGAQRAHQQATDEQVPQALSNWRPTITATANVDRTHIQYNPASIVNLSNGAALPGTRGFNTSKTVGVQVVQNIYRGGRTEAQTNEATHVVKAGQSQLKATEQSVLLAAAQSYLDVVRDQSTVEIGRAHV